MCECMHKTVANVLQITTRTTTISALEQAEQVKDNVLATAIHATWCAVNHLTRPSSWALKFCRNMFVDVPIITDFVAIRDNRQ